jgi:transcription antitermination factor NusG
VRRSRRVIYSGYRWFVLRVEGSFEKRAALALEMYGQSGNVPDFDLVKQIWVPQMTVQAPKPDGSMKFRRVSTLPGYLLVRTILSYDLYGALQRPGLPHVFGWLRCRDSWPSEVAFSEVRVLNRLETYITEPRRIPFSVGEAVRLPGLGVSGTVLAAARSHLVVEVPMFNRKVPINVRSNMFSELTRMDNSS